MKPTGRAGRQSEPIDVQVEKLVYGGEGLARVDGQVILVPFVLPGEAIQTRPQTVKTGLLRGAPPKILTAAEERVAAPCEYFGRCGGCQYQHAAYEFQVAQKRAILLETLERLGGLTYQREIAAITAEPWAYRNRIQLHFEARHAGFRQAGSHELQPIDDCPIAAPRLVEAVDVFAKAARAPQWPKFLRTLEIFTNGDELQLTVTDSAQRVASRFFEWCDTLLPRVVPGVIEYQAAQHKFRISRRAFFQVNRFLIDALVEEALRDVAGNFAVDAYAGVGLFSLALAKHVERVEAIERGGPAFYDLQWNAAQQAPNVRALKNSAEEFLKGLAERPDILIADPPRAGLGREACEQILRVKPKRLVLVSCDPATLSRDLKLLRSIYEVDRLTLVDLFPQTYHFETVAHLALG